MNLIIREENEKDYFETEAMTRRAFFNKYGPGCNEHLMVHVLRKHPVFMKEFSRVAEADGHIVGLIMYFKAKIVTEDKEVIVPSFGPLCADHSYKNQGIGSRLLQETLPLVKAAGYPGVLIMGEPDYYPKHGFQRAGTFGITDANGNVFDAFLGIEFEKDSLHIPGGRFIEPEDICEFPEAAVSQFDAQFEYLQKTVRPCQWGYPNPSDEKNGYHLIRAVEHPREFESLFSQYIKELSIYDNKLLKTDPSVFVKEIRENVTDASYLICVKKQFAGLLVTSVPKDRVTETDCASYLQEIYVLPEFRSRGIAKDIFLTFLKNQKQDVGFCYVPESKSGKYFLRLLNENNYPYETTKEDEIRLFCHVKVNH